MAKIAGLVQKKSAFFYVRRIPETIKPMFGNKTQLTIPLQTSDPRIAANRARAKAAEIDIAFQEAKLGIQPSGSLSSPKVSLSQLETAARLYLHECEMASRGVQPNIEDEIDAGETLVHLANPKRTGVLASNGLQKMLPKNSACQSNLAMAIGPNS